MMTASDITDLFERVAHLKVGVIGDFALDLYYALQTHTSERSLETGQDVFWGSQPRASLGAAGNVVQNLVALGIKNVRVIGCVGNDLFGREMRYLFDSLRVNTDLLHTPAAGWDTCVYTKPMVGGDAEANRIDFGTQNRLADVLFAELLLNLEQVLPELDVLIINQQFANPLLNEDRVASLNNLISRFSQVRFVADMRQFGKKIRGAVLKVNTAELAQFQAAALPNQPDIAWCVDHARLLGKQTNGPIVVTRGEAGILYVDQDEIYSVEGLALPGEVDTVGAGDTVVAAIAACLGADASPAQAITVANLAAAVTVQKLKQTGTASQTEILQLLPSFHTHDQRSISTSSSGTAYLPDSGATSLLD